MSQAVRTLVIFGATGDLTARKLIPSLYSLARKERLPGDLRIVGMSRSPYSDEAFRAKLAPRVKEHTNAGWDEKAWADFAQRLHYVSGDATTPEGLGPLKD